MQKNLSHNIVAKILLSKAVISRTLTSYK